MITAKINFRLMAIISGVLVTFSSFYTYALPPLAVPAVIAGLRLGASMARNERMIVAANAAVRAMAPGAAKNQAQSMVNKTISKGIATGALAIAANSTWANSNFGTSFGGINLSGGSILSGGYSSVFSSSFGSSYTSNAFNSAFGGGFGSSYDLHSDLKSFLDSL